MRESIIFLNIVLLALVLAGRMIFNDIDYGQGEEAKRHVNVCSMEEYGGFHFFLSGYFWQKYKKYRYIKSLIYNFKF